MFILADPETNDSDFHIRNSLFKIDSNMEDVWWILRAKKMIWMWFRN